MSIIIDKKLYLVFLNEDARTAKTLKLPFHATKLVIIFYQTKNVFLVLWKDVWIVKVLVFVRNVKLTMINLEDGICQECHEKRITFLRTV